MSQTEALSTSSVFIVLETNKWLERYMERKIHKTNDKNQALKENIISKLNKLGLISFYFAFFYAITIPGYATEERY